MKGFVITLILIGTITAYFKINLQTISFLSQSEAIIIASFIPKTAYEIITTSILIFQAYNFKVSGYGPKENISVIASAMITHILLVKLGYQTAGWLPAVVAGSTTLAFLPMSPSGLICARNAILTGIFSIVLNEINLPVILIGLGTGWIHSNITKKMMIATLKKSSNLQLAETLNFPSWSETIFSKERKIS
jgi:hypothetical protein